MNCKGFFLELLVDGHTVFSCVTQRMDQESFDKVWAVAGERIFALAEQRVKEQLPIRHGEIRVSPVYD